MASLDELIAALDDVDSPSTTTSVRQPAALRRALRIAVELGLAPNANDATNQALRATVDAFAQRLALEQHYAEHPGCRPPLREVAQTMAALDRSPVANRLDLLERAEREVVVHRPHADAEDVLLWATSLLAHESGRTGLPRSATA